MYLSNRLTFSLFSVLLVAALAFVATPAMAATTVTAQVTAVTAADNTTAGSEVQGEKVVTIKYSENANPAPTLADFTSGTSDPNDLETVATTPTSTLSVALAGSGTTFTLTFLGPTDGSENPVIPAFKLPGYVEIASGTLNEDVAGGNNAVVDFTLEANTLAGKGYAIIATFTVRATDATSGNYINPSTAGNSIDDTANPIVDSYPTLPTNVDGLVRRDWDDHYNAASVAGSEDMMPDLWAHFQGGHRGTLDLTVVMGDTDPTNGVLDTTATNATTRVGDVNARTVVINEVMWARDQSQVGSTAELREQWIEIYNTKTTPVPFENIWFTLSNNHPAPTNASTDRLSTNPSFTSVWDITGRGQDGNAGADDGSGKVVFASMQRDKGLGNGWDAGKWTKSGDLFLPNFQGTPGKANFLADLPVKRDPPGADIPDKKKIIINEIGNLAKVGSGNNARSIDWVELRNVTDTAQSLEKWALSIVTAYNNEAEIVRFPKYSIPARGVLLLVNADPKDTPLARGRNIKKSIEDQDFGFDGNISYLIVKGEANHGFTGKEIDLPDNNDWMLILRSGQPWNVGDNRTVYNTGFKVEDVAGPAAIVVKDLNKASPRKEKKSDGKAGGDIWETTLFPLNGRKETQGDKNHLRYEKDGVTRELVDGTVWKRDGGKHGFQAHAFTPAVFTGIGYDRNVPADNTANFGTPGYDNGIAKGKVADITTGKLVISELMLATDNGRYPQWIELQNTSKTHGIHFASDGSDPKTGWQIIIENYNSGTWSSSTRPLHVTINLKEWFNYIPPNQSVLIAAFVSSWSDNLPENRVADVTVTKRDAFKMEGRRDSFLNAEGGFYIKIIDGDGNVSDEVGNLDGVKENVREGIGIDEPKGFSWPTSMTDDGARISLIRLKDDGTKGKNGMMGISGTARTGVPGMQTDEEGNPITDANGDPVYNMQGAVAPMGSTPGELGKDNRFAWIHATDLLFLDVPRGHQTWLGTSTDIGTPLHIAGTPLPVELSFFRPTLEDGQVTIQWTTESELDNAGFNILRSETRNGEFTQVNEQMIQGKGTTAERSSYKWVDTTAKPGAVYYYQIEDVSFAGEHNTLATTKLKGLISAKGKLTTSWGDIKDASQ